MRRRLLFVALSVAGPVVACQIVAGIERSEKFDPVAEAGPDTAPVPEAAPTPDPCGHVLPPPPPATDDEPNVSLPEFFLALRKIDLLAPDPASTLGFDLDGVCTCEKRPETAFEGGVSCDVKGPTSCDGDGGVDNQVARLLKDYAGFIDLDKAANLNDRIETGQQTALLIISKYNGRANDKEVAFGLFTSEGMLEPSPCAGSTLVNGFYTPGWCGEDIWSVSSSTITGVTGKFVAKAIGTGYVNNYDFVVTFSGDAQIPFAGYRLTVGSPVSTGRLVPLDDKLEPIDTSAGPALDRAKRWRMDKGVLAGRIQASQMLAAIGTVNTPGDAGGGQKPPLCTSSQFFPLVKAGICDGIDIHSAAALDFVPGVKCDSLSVAIGLTSGPAKVGAVVDGQTSTNVCFPSEDGGGPLAGPPGVDYRCP